MSGSPLKSELPSWVGIVVIVVGILVLIGIGYYVFTANGAPSKFPPGAVVKPTYGQPGGYMPPRPSNPYNGSTR
ncbi:hypothetical protein [Chthonomonas calidirosea]|uniref:hypothetical protein n=1 Tax=Chthonomonas calidirosea TaxID=454171 RepID=UPI0006ECCAD1|nr:hypothetical protein [Chthonomonas calidirosea]CEK18101.1 hypothetical protein CP488_02068 [Chthonomonas calidirosea]